MQLADVHYQRSTSCHFLKGLEARSLAPLLAQIRAVVELRHDRISSRNVGRNSVEDDRHLRTVKTSSFPGIQEERTVEEDRRHAFFFRSPKYSTINHNSLAQ